jgi:putative ABC transport system permease protein
MLKFSISNAFRRKTITFLAILGAALGAGLMTVLLSLSGGMDAKLNSTLDKVAGDILVSSKDASVIGGFIGGGSPISEKVVTDIRQMDGVKNTQPIVSTVIPTQSLKSIIPIGTPFQGVNPSQNKESGGALSSIITGRGIENPYEVVVGKSAISQTENAGGSLKIGDVIKVPVISVTPQSALSQASGNIPTKEFKVVGIFETGNEINDRGVVGNIEDVRAVTGIPTDMVNTIRVTANSSGDVERVANAINDKYKDSATPIQTTVSKDLLGDINKTMDIFRNFLLIISAVAAVAGGVSIMIIMLMSVTERMQEFGILKAAGWSNKNILLSVFVESLTLAIIGSFVGLGFGFALGKFIDSQLGEHISLLSPDLAIKIILFGIVMGVLGGIYPAWRAARVSPIETLKSA